MGIFSSKEDSKKETYRPRYDNDIYNRSSPSHYSSNKYNAASISRSQSSNHTSFLSPHSQVTSTVTPSTSISSPHYSNRSSLSSPYSHITSTVTPSAPSLPASSPTFNSTIDAAQFSDTLGTAVFPNTSTDAGNNAGTNYVSVNFRASVRIVMHDANNYVIPDDKNNNAPKRKLPQFGKTRYARFVLRPCPQYLSKTGCNISLCYRFHVCQFWLRGNCNNSSCPFDHHFHSPNNSDMSQTLIFRNFDEEALKEKIKRNMYGGKDLKDGNTTYICSEFIFKKCNKNNCEFHHINSAYSWQLCQDGKWIPFPRNQNEDLERAFCNPRNSTYTLRDRSKHIKGTRPQQLNRIFLQEMEIDFEGMSLTSNQKFYRINRLSTQSDLATFKSVCTRWLWYWQEFDESWVFYTHAYVNNMLVIPFSDYIESQYLKNVNINFQPIQPNCQYEIDFSSMKQTNQRSSVSRKLKRRPMYREVIHWKDNTTIRSLWSITADSEEIFIRESISSSSPEFTYIQNMISKTLSVSEMHLERIENIHLWAAYQLKKDQILRTYKNDVSTANEQLLFHGTSAVVVDKICSENLDWRLYGTKVGNIYGKGTYFANRADVSNHYSMSDDQGFKWMFLAIVLVGKATVGNTQMIIPPIDPQTSKRFDTTVNDENNPCIFVKYNLDDYYPAYVFKYKEL